MASCRWYGGSSLSRISKSILDFVIDAGCRFVGPSAHANHTCQPCLSHEQPIRMRATGRDAQDPPRRNLRAAWGVRFRQEHLAQYPGLARPAFGGPVPTLGTALGGQLPATEKPHQLDYPLPGELLPMCAVGTAFGWVARTLPFRSGAFLIRQRQGPLAVLD